MDEYLDAIAGAMRRQVEGGRSHGQLAVELQLKRRLVSKILCGERRVGAKTLVAIIRADPPWLCDVLARMLTNLSNAYIQREDWRGAITAIQYLQRIQPELDWHLRDLGYLYLYVGSLLMAAQYLEEYLRRSPDATDFDNVRSSLQIVAGRLSLWN